MLLDVLDQFDTVKVCGGYEKPDGEVIADFPADLKQLASCRPVYKTPGAGMYRSRNAGSMRISRRKRKNTSG